jgi:hypothetical protein
MNNRNLIIGAVVIAVAVVAGYFVLTAVETAPPQPTPPTQTQPKS